MIGGLISAFKILWYAPNKKMALYLFRDIFIRGEYDAVDWKNIRTVVDVGANIGMFSAYVLTKSPQCTILAYEPQTEGAELIGSVFYRNVICLNHGLGDRYDVRTIYRNFPGDPTATTQSHPRSGSAEIRIAPAYFAVEEKVDLVKIDAEGAEYEILKNIDAHGCMANINRLLVELHQIHSGKCLEIIGRNFDTVRFMSNVNHDVFTIYAENSK